jgi:hypothetical protein
MNVKEVQEYLDAQTWVRAKSYDATFPHYYINKNKSSDQRQFEEVIKFIRSNGIAKSFFKKQYLYLELGAFEYWDMGRPAMSTIILNKAPINDNARYRIPQPTEEAVRTLKSKLLERDSYLELLLSKTERTQQDQRQIDFLMNTTRRIDGGGKNIIDNFNQKVIYE